MKALFLLMVACVGASLSSYSQAERVELPLSDPGRTYAQNHVWISHGQTAQLVLGAESPFGQEQADRALRVRNDLTNESQFRFRARLWGGVTPAPLKGSLEVALNLQEGTLQLNVGANPDPASIEAESALLKPEQVHSRLVLTSGKPPVFIFAKKSQKIADRMAGVSLHKGIVKVKIEWDYTSGETPYLKFFLNKEPLISAGSDSPDWVPTAEMLDQGGINVLTIISISGEQASDYFIGPISFVHLGDSHSQP